MLSKRGTVRALPWLLIGSLLCLSAANIRSAYADNDIDQKNSDTKMKMSEQFDLTALHPVKDLDVVRYMGGWFEIAKYPNRFQKKCASNTHAEYMKRADGQITVLNSCLQANGKIDQVEGLARPDRSDPTNPSKLEVRFAPAWLSWLPLVWGKYWVVMLDPDYRYAVVSEPGRKYLWILSRTPQMDPATYQAILQKLPALGLDPAKLQKSVQTDSE